MWQRNYTNHSKESCLAILVSVVSSDTIICPKLPLLAYGLGLKGRKIIVPYIETLSAPYNRPRLLGRNWVSKKILNISSSFQSENVFTETYKE